MTVLGGRDVVGVDEACGPVSGATRYPEAEMRCRVDVFHHARMPTSGALSQWAQDD